VLLVTVFVSLRHVAVIKGISLIIHLDYNVFAEKFKNNAVSLIGPACFKAGIISKDVITEIIELTAAGLVDEIRALPQIKTDAAYQGILVAGQQAYAKSYPWVYYISLAFGGLSIIACFFLGNITKYMDNHVAVDLNDPNQAHHHFGHHDHKKADGSPLTEKSEVVRDAEPTRTV
jgi:hypothetical protein